MIPSLPMLISPMLTLSLLSSWWASHLKWVGYGLHLLDRLRIDFQPSCCVGFQCGFLVFITMPQLVFLFLVWDNRKIVPPLSYLKFPLGCITYCPNFQEFMESYSRVRGSTGSLVVRGDEQLLLYTVCCSGQSPLVILKVFQAIMTFMSLKNGKGFYSNKSTKKLFQIEWKLNVNLGLQLRKELGWENSLTHKKWKVHVFGENASGRCTWSRYKRSLKENACFTAVCLSHPVDIYCMLLLMMCISLSFKWYWSTPIKSCEKD